MVLQSLQILNEISTVHLDIVSFLAVSTHVEWYLISSKNSASKEDYRESKATVYRSLTYILPIL